MAQDAAQVALSLLQASSAVTDLVTNGASNVLESGDLTIEVLHDAEELRRTAGEALVLGVSVQDAGEVIVRGNITRQMVIARVLDRRNSFDAIRSVRFAIISALNLAAGPLDDGGIVQMHYEGRSGHKVDRTYGVDFESITFGVTVQTKEE